MPFICSICGEESTRICARCTKDACDNHLCEKCLRCSDCCECEVKLSEPAHEPHRPDPRAAEPELEPEPEPEPEEAIEPGPEPVQAPHDSEAES
jgi:hypothetical protein